MSPSDPTATPARRRRKRRLPRVVSHVEAARLLDAAADGSERGVRDRLALELMYRAGLRVSEVVKLVPRDVEEDGVIRVYDAKGGDGTAYYDPLRVGPLLRDWLEIRQRWLSTALFSDQRALFVRQNGRPLTARYLQRLVRRLKERTGVAGVCTPHVLRHTFATELLEEGLSITEVQAALRHAHLQTTAVYLHVRDEALRRKIAGRG